MDFINQAIDQTKQLFESMTPAARITSVLLLGVIVVSLGYLFQHQSYTPDDYLFEGEFLAPRDADAVEAAISQANLNGYLREGGRFRVPRAQKAKYMGAVADAGALPPNFHGILDKALDASPFTDRETRRQMIKNANERRLSMIVTEMDGVQDAKVIYDIRKSRGLSRRDEVTATVSVTPSSGEGLDGRRVRMIRKAVAGAIAGLSQEMVTVTNNGDGMVYSGDGNIDFDDRYFQTRQAYERALASDIQKVLTYIPGAVVRVTAELDEALERTTETLEPKGEPSTLSDSSETHEKTETRNAVVGRPGLVAQGPGRSEAEDSTEVIQNKDTRENKQSDMFVGRSNTITHEAGLIPRTVRATIAIPTDYAVKVWREQNHDTPEEELTSEAMERLIGQQKLKIQGAVAPLLPKQLAQSSFPNVEVNFFQSLTPKPIEQPSAVTTAFAWLGQHSNTLLMASVMGFSLLMLRSVAKGGPKNESLPSLANLPPVAEPPAEPPAEKEPPQNKEPEEDRPRLQFNKGPNLKEDLSAIVQEDPDAAAAILRSWIGNAA